MRRVFPFLTALLSRPQRRQEWDSPNSGQHTIWTSTPTEIISYRSTEIITLTSWVPCPVLTSYTTTTECYDCGCPGCITTTPEPEPVPCASCPVPVPVPVNIICQAKACTTVENGNEVTLTTPYYAGEYAYATIGAATETYVAQEDCSGNFYSPPIFATAQTDIPSCAGVVATVTQASGVTMVTYTYTSGGAVFVVATTIAVVGGPFQLDTSGVGSRLDGGDGHLLLCLWAVAAGIAGVGMVVL